MIEHRYPKPSTVKRLFAVSGNECAFEKCELPLVEPNSGKVTGRICHINARREKGPRFLITQSEEQNRGFDNLLLMCPIHHDVIDSDIKSYPEDRLIEIKKEHEDKFSEDEKDIGDDKINKLIQNINIESIKINSFFSISNVGHGQIANQIVNNTEDTAKMYILERKISSLRQLQSIYGYILPDKVHPEMDWDDALIDIARRFDSIKSRIAEFKLNFGSLIDDTIESKLDDCLSSCTEGSFEVNNHNLDVTTEGYNYADNIFEKFTEILKIYKEEIRNYMKENA